ncbi:unnamed protein product [Triticum aestivum]|uniref:DUF7597 domain-containing protein n=1 Tax=Triticum aestivum TaxID=4565 RepID=A0A7H4LGN9_WHEAT|nr:unnamed protein product [Triticum aestivum]
MASFPFDPASFLPEGFHAIDVEGRPACHRVLHGNLVPANEDLAIATIIPMPQGEVSFINVREILLEFLQSKRIGVSDVTKSPFGQAYVIVRGAADRDFLVNRGPHAYDDIHIVFQRHNEGLNWKNFNLIGDVWLMVFGFPVDLRSFHELSNATASFRQLMFWDRFKSSDAVVALKVKVDALKDVPASLVVSGAKNFSGQSWTCPVVIVDDNPIGVPPPDEDTVPEDGNPHPRPPEQFHHPNQNNLMVGPVAFHLLQPEQHNLPVIEEAPAQDEEDEGWGHWAMPQQQQLVDVEIQAREFLELNDLMGPLEMHVEQPEDEYSGLT